MNINFPPPPPGYSATFMTQFAELVKKAFLGTIAKDEATRSITLLDNNLVSWTVTVSTLGALVITKNDGKTRP
jgi:hypothetical protein